MVRKRRISYIVWVINWTENTPCLVRVGFPTQDDAINQELLNLESLLKMHPHFKKGEINLKIEALKNLKKEINKW